MSRNIEARILKALETHEGFPMSLEDLVTRLRCKKSHQPEIQSTLETMEDAGFVVRVRGRRWTVPDEADLIPGRMMMARSGKGTLLPDDVQQGRIEIDPADTGTALHQDRILVRRDPGLGPRGERATKGKVIRVLERSRTTLVGAFQRGKRFCIVIPDDGRFPEDVYVTDPGVEKVKHGDKVLVSLEPWESRHVNPEGTILEVLGAPRAQGVDMESILLQYSLRTEFPEEAVKEARAFGSQVRPSDLKGRKDCRKHPVITIDPDDAKDFDDAICVLPEANGNWRLWVHIADVSHYVKPGTALDVEARERGNSTYLVDRVIPMLPEELSNELCSLKPHVDRLTRCVECLLDRNGKVLEYQAYASVIHSTRRFTYQEAMALIEAPKEDPISHMVVDAHRLAMKLRKNRFRLGGLDLDMPETKIRLDENGAVIRIDPVNHDESHQLIEEFMLLANDLVARKLREKGPLGMYRVHEDPDPGRLAELREMVSTQGVSCGRLENPTDLQRLMKRIEKVPAAPALKIAVLRSMKRARYATDPIGHYGLAKRDYTHFTSPIRRYADLEVHRLLFGRNKPNAVELSRMADHASFTERNSADAEVDSRRIKLMAYLEPMARERQPQVFRGWISDIRNFGFFVEVPDLGLSGLVRLSSIDNEFFRFDPRRGKLTSRRTSLGLGDPYDVMIKSVDWVKKQIDFRPVPGASKKQGGGVEKSRKRTEASGDEKRETWKRPKWQEFKERSQKRKESQRETRQEPRQEAASGMIPSSGAGNRLLRSGSGGGAGGRFREDPKPRQESRTQPKGKPGKSSWKPTRDGSSSTAGGRSRRSAGDSSGRKRR